MSACLGSVRPWASGWTRNGDISGRVVRRVVPPFPALSMRWIGRITHHQPMLGIPVYQRRPAGVGRLRSLMPNYPRYVRYVQRRKDREVDVSPLRGYRPDGFSLRSVWAVGFVAHSSSIRLTTHLRPTSPINSRGEILATTNARLARPLGTTPVGHHAV